MKTEKCSKWNYKDKNVAGKGKDFRTRILVECSSLIASVRVGVLDVLAPLEQKEKCIIKFIETGKIRAKHIKWCDVLVTVRGAERATLEIVRLAKKYDRFVIYYLDDDLLNVPTSNKEEKMYYEQIVHQNLPQIIALSDCLWGVNPNVKKRYIGFCPTRRWVENRVPIKLMKINKECNEIVKIIFAGSTGHQALFREVISPVIRELAYEYSEKMDFTCLGINSGIAGLENVHNIKYFDDYNRYREFVYEGNFDIGVAIVRDEPFYHCKYYNKFLEYTSIGCVGIYSDVEPYTFVVKNGENGYLCKNTFEEWKRTIEKVVFNRKERISCLENATKLLQTEHDAEQIENKLIKDIPEFITYKADKIRWYRDITFNPNWIYVKDRLKILYSQQGVFFGNILLVYKIIKKVLMMLGVGNLHEKES